MKFAKPIARALSFEQNLIKLGFKPEQFKVSLTPVGSILFKIKQNGVEKDLGFHCFGFLPIYNEQFNWEEWRQKFKDMNDEEKESLLKQNNFFMSHYINGGAIIELKDLPAILEQHKFTPPNTIKLNLN